MEKEEIIIDVEVEGVKEAKSQLDDVADSTNKAKEETEEYQSTLSDTVKEMSFMGVSINSLKEGFKGTIGVVKNSVTSLKAFKVALAATGIGAIVVALGTLATAFSQTQKGMDLVEDVTTTLSAAWRELVNLADDLGSILGDLFSGTVSLGEAWDKAGDAVNNYVEETKEAIEVTKGINAAQRQLDAEGRDYIVTLAKQNFELAEQKRIGEDVSRNIEQRIEATGRARDIIVEQGEKAVEFAQRAFDLEKQRLEGLTLTDEETERLRNLEAQIYIARGEAQERDIEFQNKYNALLLEQSKLRQQEVLNIEGITTLETDLSNERLKGVQVQKKAITETAKGQQEYAQFSLGNTTAEVQGNAIAAITKTAASVPFPLNIPLIAVATAIVQSLISRINSVLLPSLPSFGDGGMLDGPSHAQGGILINAEGGEGIINKRSMANPQLRALASAINQAGGGVPFFADGGIVPGQLRDIEQSISSQRTVLILEDLNTTEQRVEVRDSLSSL